VTPPPPDKWARSAWLAGLVNARLITFTGHMSRSSCIHQAEDAYLLRFGARRVGTGTALDAIETSRRCRAIETVMAPLRLIGA
jgi:hypothetical protein